MYFFCLSNVDISVQRPQLLAAFFPAERGASPHINLNRLSTRWRILVLAGEMIDMLETAIKPIDEHRCTLLQASGSPWLPWARSRLPGEGLQGKSHELLQSQTMKESFNILVIAELREIKGHEKKFGPIKLINKTTEKMVAKNDDKSLSVLCP